MDTVFDILYITQGSMEINEIKYCIFKSYCYKTQCCI